MRINEVFQADSTRANSYIEAVQKNPEVRTRELRQVLERVRLKPGQIILDVPSLGDNFRHAIADEPVHVTSCDYEPQTAYQTTLINERVYQWPIPRGYRLVSVASLHHISNLKDFLKAAQYNLVSNGMIHIADVDPYSAVSRFLDAEVHGPNEKGIYRTFSGVPGVTFNEVLSCPWLFDTKDNTAAYCRALFNFGNLSTDEVLGKLDNYGLLQVADNFVSVDWKLRYVDIQLSSNLDFDKLTDS